MAGCGAAPRPRPGWRGISAGRRGIRSGAGMPCGGSAGRSSRRAHGTRARRHPRSGRRWKKVGARGGAGQGGAPRPPGRGLGRGRAPPRPEADPAAGLGAGGGAAGRPRPPPLRVAARHRLRPAHQRRSGLVPLDRSLEAALRCAPCDLRTADRGGAPPQSVLSRKPPLPTGFLSGGETSLAASATRRASAMASRRAQFRSARAAPAPPSGLGLARRRRDRRRSATT